MVIRRFPSCRHRVLYHLVWSLQDDGSRSGISWRYLQTSGQTQLTLTFDEIAALAGTALDHSFLTCKKELPAYGYAVEKISMKQQTVIFHKLPEGGSQ